MAYYYPSSGFVTGVNPNVYGQNAANMLPQYGGFNPSPPPTPVVNVVWITDEKEVDTYPVGPNSAVLLWNDRASTIHLKQADVSGRPSVKRYFISEDSEADKNQEGFVSRDEFDTLLGDVKAMKKDLYGLAGKKKQPQKEEE